MEAKMMTVRDLQEKLSRKDPVFILDVRPAEQRQEWSIAGSMHVDAYKKLNAGDESALDSIEIPRSSTVVAVCAAGRTSMLAAALLARKGIDAWSLEGGMKQWNYAWSTAEIEVPGGVRIIQVRRAAKGVLSYLVGSANEAIVIDASLAPNVYAELAEKNAWTIRYVMDTHIHADYVSRTRELANETGAKHLLLDKAKVHFPVSPVTPGDCIKFGRSKLQFIHTPGHTWESATFKLDDTAIFTGDTLFIDGIGRPDLKAGQEEVIAKARSLYTSLKHLLSLNPSLLVLPAHSSGTIAFDNKIIGDTIISVKERIAQLKLSEPEFVEYASSRIPPTPANYLNIAEINKNGFYDARQLADLEAGGNHCAIA
jgi:glyoxylase-like metal-dependent hydrolase (beta-lactamase superfamily II)/rhodanese-related sulfurtransferase